jgi:hypothetical protein
LAAIHRRFLALAGDRRDVPAGGALFGGLPFLGMSWETLAGLALAAGVATLFVRGVQRYWEIKTRPFGELRDLNFVALHWAVTDESDARVLASKIGLLFLGELRSALNAYDQEYFQVPYTIDPKEWGLIEEFRHRITARHLGRLLGLFRDFGRGLSILSARDWGCVYREIFGDFMDKVFLVMAPMTRWDVPPSQENLADLKAFRSVLREQMRALELKLDAPPAAQAV